MLCGRDEPPARPLPCNNAGDPAGRPYQRPYQLLCSMSRRATLRPFESLWVERACPPYKVFLNPALSRDCFVATDVRRWMACVCERIPLLTSGATSRELGG